MNALASSKLKTAFHESFRLSRDGLSQIIRAVNEHRSKSKLNADDFRKYTTLGVNQIKSSRPYAKGSGLLTSDERLTDFGSVVIENDSTISHPSTMWAIHYFMSVPHQNGPAFWNYLSAKLWTEHEELSREAFTLEIKNFLQSRSETDLAEETYKVAASIYLGTYTDENALGQLEILESDGGNYRVREPRPISAGAFACILADYWESVWNDRDEVLLREVNEGELAALLLLSSGQVNNLLGALSEKGLVTRQRRVPPFKVTREWKDAKTLWREQLYS